MQPSHTNWYAVRTVLTQVGTALVDGQPAWTYKERITLWTATDAESAIAQAEAEAVTYGRQVEATYLGDAQAFPLPGSPESGAEVFATLRSSLLGPNDYLRRFHGTDEEVASSVAG